MNAFFTILQNNDARNIMINFLNEITGLNLKEITFNSIEKFQDIVEYDFYLVNLIGVSKNGLEEPIFIKNIRKGKIKESLFCICDLAYEKYFQDDNDSKDNFKKRKKISILEEKENVNYINKISVKLFEDNFSKEKANLKIYFAEISKMIEQSENKKITWKGMKKYIELNPKDIIIVGVENKH